MLSIEPISVGSLGSGGAEVFGYGEAFAQELQRIGKTVQTILDGMAGRLDAASAEVDNGLIRDSLRDGDYFLAVARSLLAGTNHPPVPTFLGQDSPVLTDTQSLLSLSAAFSCVMSDETESGRQLCQSKPRASSAARP